MKRLWRSIYYFFPVQLILEHLKRHYVILFLWLLLFMYISGGMGYTYGIYTLFLAPEYLGKVGFLSFLILGFTTGIFIMAFHITTYITSGYRFPIIGSLRRPFYRFALNNFILPVSFLTVYILLTAKFQKEAQLFNRVQIWGNILAFLSGVGLFYLFTLTYFYTMNEAFRRLISLSEGRLGRWRITRPLQKMLHRDIEWKKEMTPVHNIGTSKISYYLHSPIHIRRAPRRLRLTPEETLGILHRNLSFAVIFSTTLIAGLLLIGIFMDHPAFNIPAAASILLILTLGLLFYIEFYTLFKEFALWFFLAILFLIIVLINTGSINREGQAYGISYRQPDQDVAFILPTKVQVQTDSLNMIRILERWKRKNTTNPGEKPLAVFVHTAGGGLKAALWTYYALATADSISGDRLLDQTILITGASGGMVGAAYLRELQKMRHDHKIHTLLHDSLFSGLSADMLNPIALQLALKDWFISFSTFSYDGIHYRKDRGWALEEMINRNTKGILDHPLDYYRKPEQNATIPLILLTPTILNSGEQLVISPQPLRFLSQTEEFQEYSSFIPFRETYASYNPGKLRFTTALRMNASYPVISPVITLPGNPVRQLTDAGLRDNFGYLTGLSFIHYFRKWLSDNTSGILMIHIDNKTRKVDIKISAFDFLRSFQSVYQDYFNIQKMNGMLMESFSMEGMDVPISIQPLRLDESRERISISWHLTEYEKKRIKTSLTLEENRKSLEMIHKIFQQN